MYVRVPTGLIQAYSRDGQQKPSTCGCWMMAVDAVGADGCFNDARDAVADEQADGKQVTAKQSRDEADIRTWLPYFWTTLASA